MKKLTLLLILCSTTILKSYSQNTEKPNWKEINTFLAEGLECKELIKIKNSEIHLMDSMLITKDTINANNERINKQHEVVEDKLKQDVHSLYTQLNEQKDKQLLTEQKLKREIKRKKVWRKITIVVTGVVTVVTVLLFL